MKLEEGQSCSGCARLQRQLDVLARQLERLMDNRGRIYIEDREDAPAPGKIAFEWNLPKEVTA